MKSIFSTTDWQTYSKELFWSKLSVVVVCWYCCIRCFIISFLHFYLLQNHCLKMKLTWHKTSLSEGDSSLVKWLATPIRKGRWLQNSRNTWTTFKNLLLQNHWANFNQSWHKAYLIKEDSNCSNKRPRPFPREKISKKLKYIDHILKSPKPLGQF